MAPEDGARGVGDGCDSGVMGPGCAHIFGFPKIDFQKNTFPKIDFWMKHGYAEVSSWNKKRIFGGPKSF